MENILELIDKGGVLIYPLLVLLVWGLGIIVLKSFLMTRHRVIKPKVVEEVEQLLLKGKIPEAMSYCKQHPAPMSEVMLAAIINFEKSEDKLKEVLEEAGRQQIPAIKKYLTTLGTISSVAPLLGLLGTVVGMIQVFANLASQLVSLDRTLAGGISEALLTTACGMVVAMPTLAFYNHFTSKMQNLIIEMEKISLKMVRVLKR